MIFRTFFSTLWTIQAKVAHHRRRQNLSLTEGKAWIPIERITTEVKAEEEASTTETKGLIRTDIPAMVREPGSLIMAGSLIMVDNLIMAGATKGGTETIRIRTEVTTASLNIKGSSSTTTNSKDMVTVRMRCDVLLPFMLLFLLCTHVFL